MSTRERAITITVGLAWLIPAAIAAVAGDLHKLFGLTLSAAAVLTLSRIILLSTRRSADTIATALEELRKKIPSDIPVPVQMAHQVGWKQGWEARDLQDRADLSDLVSVFEKRFPTPPPY